MLCSRFCAVTITGSNAVSWAEAEPPAVKVPSDAETASARYFLCTAKLPYPILSAAIIVAAARSGYSCPMSSFQMPGLLRMYEASMSMHTFERRSTTSVP